MALIPTIGIWSFNSGNTNWSVQIVKFILIYITYFFTIACIISLNQKHWLKKILISSILNNTGKISYGLYVFHPLCFHLLNTYFKSDYVLVNLILSFAISYLVATLSFYFFESKILKLKSSFQ